MKTIYSMVTAAITAIVLAGCASTAEVQKDESVNLDSYRTYMWVDTKSGEDDNGPRAAAYADINMRNAVNSELHKRGWREVSSNPDALISYDILVERSTQSRSDAVYTQPMTRAYYNPRSGRWSTIYFPSQFLGYQNYQVPVREGTITVSIVDASTDKTIWQGWITEAMNYSRFTGDEITRGVRQIFKRFVDAS